MLLIGLGALITISAMGENGLVAFLIGGLICVGAGVGTYIGFSEFDRYNSPRSWDYESGIRSALSAGNYNAAFEIAGTNSRLDQYEYLRNQLEISATRGEHTAAVERAVRINMLNIKCIYHINIWRDPTASGFDFVERLGARVYSNDTSFRRDCSDRRYNTRPQLLGGLVYYMQHNWDTQSGDVPKAFWRRGIYLDARLVGVVLEDARGDLRRAINNRDADTEEMKEWIIQVLEFIQPSPVAKQQEILSHWGG